MAPSSGHDDRSKRRETGTQGDNMCKEQEEAVREMVAEYGKSLGLREVESAKSTEINLMEKPGQGGIRDRFGQDRLEETRDGNNPAEHIQ